MKRSRLMILGLLILTLGTVAGTVTAETSGWIATAVPLHPDVLHELRNSPDGQARFLVLMANQADLTGAAEIDNWESKGRWVYTALRDTAERSQQVLQHSLDTSDMLGQVTEWQHFWIVNVVAVRGDLDAATALSRQPGVAAILPEIKLEVPEPIAAAAPEGVAPDVVEWNVRQINADEVWALGYDGHGMVVANIDTGVDYTHPALVKQYRGNLGADANGPFEHDYNWYDPFWGTTTPAALPATSNGGSPNSHGTHVMGTEAGSDGQDNQIGVAPGARWIAAFGCCPDNASLLAALQWMLAPTRLEGTEPNPDLRPHALQNSWGGPGGSLIFNQAAAALKAAGVFVSASAGNNGSYGCGSLGSPGDNPSFFSVGASTSGDGTAALSARGPDPFTGRTGPDLVAPGQSVRSAVAGDNYAYYSGTSMAGPHVTGAVALLWQANPALLGRVDYTAELLRRTAEPVFVSGEICGGVDSSDQHPNNSAGWGRLDVLRALQVAGTGDSRVEVLVVDEQGQPLPDASVTLHKPETWLGEVALNGRTDATGSYQFIVAPGEARVSATLWGYSEAETTATIDNNTGHIQLTLAALPTYTVQGRVVEGRLVHLPLVLGQSNTVSHGDLDGLPTATRASIRALAATIRVPDSPLSPVETDCSGRFTLELPAGDHQLIVDASGYMTRRAYVHLENDVQRHLILYPTWDYAVEDSRQDGLPFQWIDATEEGTRYSLRDDSWTIVPLPAGQPFSFYGEPYTVVYPSSNGFLTFGPPHDRFHGVVPYEGRPNNAIYAYAEDLNPEADRQYGTGYDNGVYALFTDGKLVLQYNEVEHWSQGDPETFQTVLELETGEITLQYQQVSWPDFTTVGIENATGERGQVYSYANSANLEPGLAVRYTPVFGQPGLSCPK